MRDLSENIFNTVIGGGDPHQLLKQEDADNHHVTGPSPQIERLMQEYILDDAKCKRICEILLKEMEDGLSRERNAKAVVKMFPTYVRALPDGSESGNFLALDLGGTNFRVLLITLKGSTVSMENKIFPIAEDIMLGPGTQLFDHIAKCIADFMETHNLKNQKLPLGFTFSFPLKQEGLNVGKLVTWTKGFKCSGVIGNDVVRMLHEAVQRRGDISIDCVAILNDTVGCLMSCAFHDHDCEIGVILGTGSNACYMERLDRVGTWEGDKGDPRQVIINTEWGAFGNNGVLEFVRTNVDREVDEESLNPGKQLYEKMISGMYMGEIARRCLVHAIKDGLILDGMLTEEINEPHRFYTKYVSEIEKDDDFGNFENTRIVLDELGYDDVTLEDCFNVRYICHIVGERAAYLASSGIATLLNRIEKPNITVAVDGSLYRYHPKFHDFMMEKISSLIKPGLKFKLMLSEDGSGKGAALVAAVAARLKSSS